MQKLYPARIPLAFEQRLLEPPKSSSMEDSTAAAVQLMVAYGRSPSTEGVLQLMKVRLSGCCTTMV